MTTFTLFLDALLALIAAGMFFFGKYGVTRQLAPAPLLVAVLDAAFARQIQTSLTPALSVVLFLLQLVVLGGSVMVLYQDRVRARNKANRRRRRKEMARSRVAFEQATAARERRPYRVCA